MQNPRGPIKYVDENDVTRLTLKSRSARAPGSNFPHVDEISHRKGQRYLTIVVDHHTGRLVWAVSGHDRKSVEAFLDALGRERWKQIELVSADMASWISGPLAASSRTAAPTPAACGSRPRASSGVLLAHGRVLPHRPAREPQVKAPWPDWVSYRPNMVWGYDLTSFPAAAVQALAIVGRKWIDWLLCPEATSLQVQVLFTRALDAEGLLEGIVGRSERLADPAAPTQTSRSCSPFLTTGRR
jgi:hypothetical protein